MLVLSRKPGEEIVTGGFNGVPVITFRVASVTSRGTVRIAIDAPAGVAINRREVYDSRLAELRAEIEAIEQEMAAA